jgi:Fe-S oxidoreductase
MDLCVGCKGCKRECPTGVDMARMKIEFKHAWNKRHGLTAQERLIAWLPRYARVAASLAPLLNLRNRIGAFRQLGEFLGFSARRDLPKWRRDRFDPDEARGSGTGRKVILFVDTFTTYFEPENARAALKVLTAAGYDVIVPAPADGPRPLCCGRTFLAEGLVDEARVEAMRMLAAFGNSDAPIIGLEPSCLFTLKDELLALGLVPDAEALSGRAMMFEEFIAAEAASGRLNLKLRPLERAKALVHGHCHQKAFDVMGALTSTLKLVPSLDVKTIDSSCCGMAGAFGYESGHYDVSMKMAEASLLPAVRAASADTLVVANGTSCRHQIADGAGRSAVHAARVLEMALRAG